MVSADVELVGLDPAGLLQAAFELQDQRNAARGQAAQLEAELAQLTQLVTAALPTTGDACCFAECTVPRCVLRHYLERPVTA